MSGELKETGNMGQVQSPVPVKAKEKKEPTMEDYFRGGLFVLVVLLLAISSLQFVGSVNQVIYTWFESEYIPISRAVFNLAMVVFCLYVIKYYLLKKKA
jgi:hypothetical protein